MRVEFDLRESLNEVAPDGPIFESAKGVNLTTLLSKQVQVVSTGIRRVLFTTSRVCLTEQKNEQNR